MCNHETAEPPCTLGATARGAARPMVTIRMGSNCLVSLPQDLGMKLVVFDERLLSLNLFLVKFFPGCRPWNVSVSLAVWADWIAVTAWADTELLWRSAWSTVYYCSVTRTLTFPIQRLDFFVVEFWSGKILKQHTRA